MAMVNKVIYAAKVLIDLTEDTISPDNMLSGVKGHDSSGAPVTGNIPSKGSGDLSAIGETVSVPAGYYPSAASKSVATAAQATPDVSIDSAGLITATATQNAGYVAAGTAKGTKQLPVQAAKDITPGTTDQIAVDAGRYTTGAVIVKALPAAEGVSF